ncbi:MAG: hypothetical protein IT204_13530 [Fimbriimonadaceae bacterium]|nr:hypothetical protein [Fimbriimonadaceae bacterium]
MTSHEFAKQRFPGALTRSELLQHIVTRLGEVGVPPDRALLAVCACPDEINWAWRRFAAGVLPGPFLLGGLAGLPFTGITGMGAYAHHVPERGAAVVLFGPHLGFGPDGQPGRVQRVHQSQPGACCGALVATVQRLQREAASGERHAGPDPSLDFQAAELDLLMQRQTRALLSAAEPVVTATERLYDDIRDQVQRLLAAAQPEFHGAPVLWIGGLFLNTSHYEEDLFAIRDEGLTPAP